MEGQVELEICANCKREIPNYNYVMHTAHCGRNISLCTKCKEPIPKAQFEAHAKSCAKIEIKTPSQPTALIENSKYYSEQKNVQDKKTQLRQEKRLARLEKLVDVGNQVGHVAPKTKSTSDLLPCQYCELELPKFDLGEHENYCGARTEKCEDCGELVMFKYRQLHQDTNHGFLKLNDEPGPKPTWDAPRPRLAPLRSFSNFDTYTSSTTAAAAVTTNNGEKLETSKEIARRLDCKTEYIRNLLHDSASITAPLRSTGAIPRYNHNKGPAPQPPHRRNNPPSELVIPCEFCNTPIPHEELIEHETGCRPDLARYNPRRRGNSPDYFEAPEPSSPDVELPCEFCSDLIPASQLLRHQATCN